MIRRVEARKRMTVMGPDSVAGMVSSDWLALDLFIVTQPENYHCAYSYPVGVMPRRMEEIHFFSTFEKHLTGFV